MARSRLLPLLLFAAALALGGASSAGAQEGTPSPRPGPPTDANCTVEPRPMDEMVALAGTPVAAPGTPAAPESMTLSDGEPADAATVAVLERTLREAVACAEAGDVARLLALYSDRFVAEQALAPEPVPIVPGQPPAGGARPASPDGGDRTPVIVEARLLPDGRAAALVTTPDPGAHVDLVFFVQEGDRWLIDEVHPAVVEGAPGTPAPSSVVNPSVEAALTDASARLGVAPGDLIVLVAEPMEWPDTALGCPKEGEFYAQVITPGWLIVVSAGDRTLEYHTDAEGRFVLCEGGVSVE